MDPTLDGPDGLKRRAWPPLREFFASLFGGDSDRRAAEFAAWLDVRGLPAGLDRSLGSLRLQLRGLLGLYAESEAGATRDAALRAAEAFEACWGAGVVDRAIERTKSRCLAERRIVPFLVFQRRSGPPRIDDSAVLAAQMGLEERDVREYLREILELVRGEARSELVADGEPPERLDELPEPWRPAGL